MNIAVRWSRRALRVVALHRQLVERIPDADRPELWYADRRRRGSDESLADPTWIFMLVKLDYHAWTGPIAESSHEVRGARKAPRTSTEAIVASVSSGRRSSARVASPRTLQLDLPPAFPQGLRVTAAAVLRAGAVLQAIVKAAPKVTNSPAGVRDLAEAYALLERNLIPNAGVVQNRT
jgi:hypothetical protein